MSEMSRGLNNWLLKYQEPVSVMRQLIGLYGEEVEAPPATVCRAIPDGTKDQMISMAKDSADQRREYGQAICKDYKLCGEREIGTRSNVKIKRPNNSIGTFHTHTEIKPEAFTPSPVDIMEAMLKNDQILCTGANNIYGTDIACYEPVDPYWSEYRDKIIGLVKDILGI